MSSEKNWFIKLFNLRQQEGKPVIYLMIFSFFVGLSMSFYFAASNAIFLRHFEPWMISISYMASGVVVWLAWFVLSRLDRWLKLNWQLIVKFLFVFTSVLAISIGVWMYDSPWIVFVMYTWVRILTYITLITFWGLAGKLFNIRQGKRIFSLLGTGEVISIIIGYFSIPILLNFLKAADLLFLASVTLLFCFFIVLIILKVFKNELSDAPPRPAVLAKKSSDYSYWTLVRKPYFRLISMMALLPIFAYLFVDFLFLSQTKIEFVNDSEAIAGFFGVFLGFVAIVELLFKLVSGRILSKYGLKPSLLLLPLVLGFTILIAAISGSLYGQVGLFFAFIAMARLLERAVRSAMYEPSFQLLYQPVPPEQRMIFQNQIEGIPKAFGTVLTGAIILLFSTLSALNLVHYSWFYLLVLILWGWVTYKMYESYRSMLKNKLFELKKETSVKAGSLDEIIQEALKHADLIPFNKYIQLLESTRPLELEAACYRLLKELEVSKQTLLIQILVKRQMSGALTLLHQIIGEQEDFDQKKVFLDAIEQLNQADRLSFDDLMILSKSNYEAERLKASFLLGASGRYNSFRLLLQLMQDEAIEVRKAAIYSCTKIRRLELYPALIDQLNDPKLGEFTANLIYSIGEPLLSELDRLFEKSSANPELQQRIIKIAGRIQSPMAIRFLRDRIHHSSRDIRILVMRELSKRQYHCTPSESLKIKLMAEESVEYILWIYASMNDLGVNPLYQDLQLALLSELEEQKEFIFLLLSLLYDANTILHIREYIESKDTTAKVYALEISEMIISQDVKEYFFPLFEDHTIQEKLSKFEHKFPQQHLDPSKRIIDIINHDFSRFNLYTKSCALNILGASPHSDSEQIKQILSSALIHPDLMLRQLAAWSLYRFNKKYFEDYTSFLIHKGWSQIEALISFVKAREENATVLEFEKIEILRSMPALSLMTDIELIELIRGNESFLIVEKSKSPVPTNSIIDPDLLTNDQQMVLQLPDEILFDFIARNTQSAASFFTATQSTISKIDL
jgi:ATP:ADP antiporter, AAA family